VQSFELVTIASLFRGEGPAAGRAIAAAEAPASGAANTNGAVAGTVRPTTGTVETAGVRIGVHDASRVEWVVSVPLRAAEAYKYSVEFTAEIPAHLHSAHDVWEHHQELARLQSPDLEELRTVRPAETTIDDVRRTTVAVAHQLKMVQDRAKRLCRSANSLSLPSPDLSVGGRLEGLVADGVALVHRGRSDVSGAGLSGPARDAQLSRERQLADEFLSTKLIDFLATVEKVIDEVLIGDQVRFSDEYQEIAARLHECLAGALEKEMGYRAQRSYVNPRADRPQELERFLERASHLKKHFQEVLFLELETELVDNRVRNWVAILMAALASTIYFFGMLAFLPNAAGATAAGISLWTGAAIAAMLYAFKDRVKEIGRQWLGARLTRHLGSRLVKLRIPERLVPGNQVVVEARENFVTQCELRDDDLNPDAGRTRRAVILRYTKQAVARGSVELEAKGVHSLKHVFRFDLSTVFPRLDDPIKRVPVLDPAQRRVRFVEAPRCYRFPVKARVCSADGVVERQAVVVVHKQGIDRIEDATVTDDQEPVAFRRASSQMVVPLARRPPAP
jgi:hypothetical protein